MSFLTNSKSKPNGAYVPPMPNPPPMPPVVSPPRERIALIYNEDKTWDVYLSGTQIFSGDTNEDMLEKLAKLLSILD